MEVKLAVSVRGSAARIALLHGDSLAQYNIWRPDAPDGVGDVHTGRVTAKMPALAGAFVDLGDTAGFLPDSAGAANLTEGTYLAVRVTRAAQAGKGPRLASVDEPYAGRPGLIRRGPGPLLELAAQFPAAAIQIDNHALLAELRPALAGRLAYRAVTFDPVLEDEIAGLHEPTAALPGGAAMHITPTPALTAIDIDSGGATGGHIALNTAIIPEITRQITLRNLSGGIVIDFAGMKARDRTKLTAPLQESLAQDPLKPRLLGFSHLGFAEIIRPRIRPPLHEITAP